MPQSTDTDWGAFYEAVMAPYLSPSAPPSTTGQGLNINPVQTVPVNPATGVPFSAAPPTPALGYSGGINNSKSQDRLVNTWNPNPALGGINAALMPPMPVPRPNVTPTVATLPTASRPHWSQSWLANATRNAMTMNALNRMPALPTQRQAPMAKVPPIQFTVRGGNPAAPTPATRSASRAAAMPSLPPAPTTWQGTATGNPYTVGKTYQAGAYQYAMTPNGPSRQGLAPQYQGMTPAQAYDAASNYDPVANGHEWGASVPGHPGFEGGGGGMYGNPF